MSALTGVKAGMDIEAEKEEERGLCLDEDETTYLFDMVFNAAYKLDC